MRCPNERQLAEYIEGLCSPRRAGLVAEHLEGCAWCRQQIAALQQATRMLQVMPAPVMPDDLWPGVAARIAAGPRPAVALWVWRAVAGAGIAACVAIGVLTVNRPQPALQDAGAATAPYVTQHQLLSARDPLANRASLGMVLASEQGSSR